MPTDFALSPRATDLGRAPFSLIAAHTMCQADPFDPERNPNGYVNFGTAENYLLWDLLEPALSAPRVLTPADTHYGPMYGSPRLREALTQLLQRRTSTPLSPDNLVVAGGAAAIIDMLAWVLFSPGDGILLASPYYSGFDFDLEARAGVKIVQVPTCASDGFTPSVAQLQAAYEKATREGIRVRGLLINNPHNPTAQVTEPARVRAFIAYAQKMGLEIIVDEIYAHSVYGDAPFESCLTGPMQGVHMVYGLAKDFALSGYKVGMAYSHNPLVVRALQTLSYLSPVSTDCQAILCTLLENEAFIDMLFAHNCARLKKASKTTVDAIHSMGGACMPTQAGLFAWLNLRAFLHEDTVAGEAELHKRLLHEARVNVSPGVVFHCEEPGWFRMCFAAPNHVLQAGLARMAALHRAAA